MEVRIQLVTFSKVLKGGEPLTHYARIITYTDTQKHKLVSLLTNDMESDPNEIIEIYRQRWEIELLFKQIKQNFPLKYFYGESANANAIKIQIWVTLIANLLLMIMKKRLIRSWSFSGLATMIRITLMYYVDFYSLFNHSEKDWDTLLSVDRKDFLYEHKFILVGHMFSPVYFSCSVSRLFLVMVETLFKYMFKSKNNM